MSLEETSSAEKGKRPLYSLSTQIWYPLVICYVAIENDPVEIVDFPINSMVDLSIAILT